MLETFPSSDSAWTIPKQNLRMRYFLSILNYLFQAIFATFTAKFITMYLYAYLTLSAWAVFLISSVSYIPLLLKPFLGYWLTKRIQQVFQTKSPFTYRKWMAAGSVILFGVLIALSFISSSSQLVLFIIVLFGAQLGFAGLDVLADNLILEGGKSVNRNFGQVQQFAAVIGAIISLLLYNVFVKDDVAAGNWQGLFLSLAGGMILLGGATAVYHDIIKPVSEKHRIILSFRDIKKKITPNHWLFICLLFFLNVAYIVDFQSEMIVDARFGDMVLRQLFLAQTIGMIIGYGVVLLGFIFQKKIFTYRKQIFVVAGVYSFAYLVLMPFAPVWLLFALSIGYSPINTLMMMVIISLMATFSPSNHPGFWYQVNAGIYALSRFVFTNLGNGLYAGLQLDPTDPLLFFIAGGLLFLNLPFLIKLQIPNNSRSIES
ncbi:hypothetical protein [Candidatus Lokiarchaeum ossiferum]|uniref:hypothetical protein n=1 Tax=Candidatus Lokiarchaeum ossiferum TaxID=2951803 RepID=UPI00352F9DB5